MLNESIPFTNNKVINRTFLPLTTHFDFGKVL